MAAPLTSQWGGLSELLLARIFAVDYDGERKPDDMAEVVAPILEGGSFALQMNWQSPFENMGPESKAPALTALIQSGALIPLARQNAERANAIGDFTGLGPTLGSFSEDTASFLQNAGVIAGNESLADLRGASGITRINSSQIFSGMAPAKFAVTLLLRAWSDPYKEVELPLRQLMNWAVPIELAPEGVLLGNLSGANAGTAIASIRRLLPSKAPTLLSMRYGNALYQRLVIESMEEPITSPRGRDGYYTEIAIPMTLATLTALDRSDIAKTYPGRAGLERTA